MIVSHAHDSTPHPSLEYEDFGGFVSESHLAVLRGSCCYVAQGVVPCLEHHAVLGLNPDLTCKTYALAL